VPVPVSHVSESLCMDVDACIYTRTVPDGVICLVLPATYMANMLNTFLIRLKSMINIYGQARYTRISGDLIFWTLNVDHVLIKTPSFLV
jgi:hypothetical protein